MIPSRYTSRFPAPDVKYIYILVTNDPKRETQIRRFYHVRSFEMSCTQVKMAGIRNIPRACVRTRTHDWYPCV